MSGRPWTNEDLEFIKNNYSTMKRADVAEVLNRSLYSIGHVAGGLGLSDPAKKGIRWTEQDLQFIKNNYRNMSNPDIAKFLGRSVSSVECKAMRLGVQKPVDFMAMTSTDNTYARKHVFNEFYFSNIDNQNKAYLLGFIWADGTVSRKNYSLHIGVRYDDIEVLDFLQKQLNANYPIRTIRYNKPNCHDLKILSINSKQLHADLNQLGIVPDKSHQYILPNIPEGLERHFIRGLFDGDGTYGWINKAIKIVNTQKTCEWLFLITKKFLSVGGSVHSISEQTYRWVLGGRHQAQKFVSWIYKDAEFFLSRKYNRFIEVGVREWLL